MAQESVDSYFRFRCLKGLRQRGLADRPEYQARLEEELQAITKAGFCGYLLIVVDFIAWAKSQDILCGPGRGSGAGSLCVYSLGITQLDPIKYGLIFERFINPDRVAPADLDCDFDMDRRHEVIEHIISKYGADRVAHIGTFGTMRSKGAIRDVARVLGLPFETANHLSSLTLPPILGKPPSLAECFEKVPELARIRNSNSPEGRVLQLAERLEGKIRSFGLHASGLVISDRPLYEDLPLSLDKDNKPVTQFDMHAIEDIGLIKFDFLGLTTLTVIAKALELVRQRHNQEIDIDNIPDGDEAVYENLRAGDTVGIFQLEASAGIRDLTVNVRPRNLDDLAAIVSIYRPGPLGSEHLSKYLKVRSGAEEPEYLVPELEPILSKTGGWMILQEEMLEIAKQLAGYTLAEADLLRRACGKKSAEEMEAQESKFKAGMLQNGFSQDVADRLWDDINYFSGYSFNACLTGDTLLNRAGRNRTQSASITIKALYEGFKSRTPWGKKLRHGKGRLLQLKSDGRIRPGYIRGIHPSGTKDIFEIHTASGRSIKGTADHRLLTDQGYKRIDNLALGDSLICVGLPVWESRKQSRIRAASQFRGHNTHYKGCGFKEGELNPGWVDGRSNLLEQAKVLVSLRALDECELCGSDNIGGQRFEFAHLQDLANLDYDFKLYHFSVNIRLLCNSCHKRLDYSKGERIPAWSKGRPSETDTIISIAPQGQEEVFDVEMAGPDHNFLANGIVSHNSHAYCYAFITYQTVWLKTHFPIEFMCAALQCNQNNEEQVARYIAECHRLGIKVLPPDVNESDTGFTVAGGAIRFGLGAVKNLGESPVQGLISQRQQPFSGLVDFASRVDLAQLNRKKVESLILAGAFDFTGQTRASLMAGSEQIAVFRDLLKKHETRLDTFRRRCAKYRERQGEIIKAQLLGTPVPKPLKVPDRPLPPEPPSIPSLPEMPLSERLAKERELLGFYVSGHPLDGIQAQDTLSIEEAKCCKPGSSVRILVVPSITKEITTKTDKKKMAFVTLEDLTGQIEGAIFPGVYSKLASRLVLAAPAVVVGTLEIVETDESRTAKLRVENILPVEQLPPTRSISHFTLPLRCSVQQALKDVHVQQESLYRAHISFRAGDGTVYRGRGLVNLRDKKSLGLMETLSI